MGKYFGNKLDTGYKSDAVPTTHRQNLLYATTIHVSKRSRKFVSFIDRPANVNPTTGVTWVCLYKGVIPMGLLSRYVIWTLMGTSVYADIPTNGNDREKLNMVACGTLYIERLSAIVIVAHKNHCVNVGKSASIHSSNLCCFLSFRQVQIRCRWLYMGKVVQWQVRR